MQRPSMSTAEGRKGRETTEAPGPFDERLQQLVFKLASLRDRLAQLDAVENCSEPQAAEREERRGDVGVSWGGSVLAKTFGGLALGLGLALGPCRRSSKALLTDGDAAKV